ncbi:MAG TPA: hypothetical protein PK926_11755 [Spirochaetota bacterium]|nr:hypothetical protein [Spirochaetota bacterium]HPI89026.1 hypothetical protein [Spirochaetota bacterium]HPR49266.1 hypothetical protein [Spirochaetota bacterium]
MEKVFDFMAYKIEKSLKAEGFTIKIDREKNVKLLIKLKVDEKE